MKNPKLFINLYLIIFLQSINYSIGQKYTANLSGPNEAPANNSPGIGQATITIANFNMRVQCSFSGLLGNVTAAHIHAPTAIAGAGTVGVATVTPTFTGFPSGVSSGSYDHIFNMSLATSFNPAFVTAHGGTVSQAWADLQAAIIESKSYFNIHSTAFGGGEIRGFLMPSKCISKKTGNWQDTSVWSCNSIPSSLDIVTLLPGHIVTIPVNFQAFAKNIELNGELKKLLGASLTLSQ